LSIEREIFLTGFGPSGLCYWGRYRPQTPQIKFGSVGRQGIKILTVKILWQMRTKIAAKVERREQGKSWSEARGGRG